MTRLLILTQKMDRNDDVLGFFHNWVERFSREFEEVTVICLGKGEVSLPGSPDSVRVFSLGKDEGRGRFTYIWRFYSLIRKYRDDYDTVLVHMNPIYVVLGSFFWHRHGKRVALWYNHTYGNFLARWAFALADRVFHTSPYAFSSGLAKSERMPAGIDTDLFENVSGTDRNPRAILYVGRLAPVKRVHILIAAFDALSQKGHKAVLWIIGSAGPRDGEYLATLKELAAPHGRNVAFLGSVGNASLPSVYTSAALTVNLTPRGNYDKTVLESMSCETPVVLSSEAFAEAVPAEFVFAEGDAESLARRLEDVLGMSEADRATYAADMRRYVTEHESLDLLARRLKESMEAMSRNFSTSDDPELTSDEEKFLNL